MKRIFKNILNAFAMCLLMTTAFLLYIIINTVVMLPFISVPLLPGCLTYMFASHTVGWIFFGISAMYILLKTVVDAYSLSK